MRISDWSSDVCSSDLRVGALAKGLVQPRVEATRAVVEERDTLGGAVIRRPAGRKRRGLAAIEYVIAPAPQLTQPVAVCGAEQAAPPLQCPCHTEATPAPQIGTAACGENRCPLSTNSAAHV